MSAGRWPSRRTAATSPYGGDQTGAGEAQVWIAGPVASNTVADAGSVDPQQRALAGVENEADSLVRSLFGKRLLREDVLDSLRAQGDLSEPVRARALALAEHYPVDANQVNEASWNLVRSPGVEAEAAHRAVRLAEAACRLAPGNGPYLNTLGVARYRAGQYREALADLDRSLKLIAVEFRGEIPGDLAFIAMAYHRLEKSAEARTTLARLREVMKQPRWSADAESKGFMSEAAALIDGPAEAGPQAKPATKK